MANDSFRQHVVVASILSLLVVVPVRAGEPPRGDVPSDVAASSDSPALPSAQADLDEDDDAALDPTEPDVVVVNLPTNMRLPRFGSNFRLTHRFAGDLRRGSFGENASNLFGLDLGAIIGFEFRMAVTRALQAAVFRTNFDKTIQIHGKYDLLRKDDRLPVAVSALASIEGTNNFQDHYAPALGAVVSYRAGTRLALYAVPMWVGHTNASLEVIDHDHGAEGTDEVVTDDHAAHERENTILLGLGARARLTRTLYVVGELTPRLDGYAPGELAYGFGIEKRVGGHAFSLTFTNSFSTTYSQLARGGNPGSLYLGFNLGRKFY